MVLNTKIGLMMLEERATGMYEWRECRRFWAHIEHTGKTNLFSKAGIGVKTVAFTLRSTPYISLFHAIEYKGRQYFITDVNRDEPLYMTVTTADIQPVQCTVTRSEEREGPNKSSTLAPCMQLLFPACVTEKYMGFQQEDPMARTEAALVLVTPKPVRLEVHDIVKLGAPGPEGAEDTRPAFAIKVCHLLDEYKNEYEMTKVEDV